MQTASEEEEGALSKDEMKLVHCCIRNNHEELKSLLDEGVAIGCRDEKGSTPLHLAVRFGSKECVDILLRDGANAKLVDGDGATPLWVAVNHNNADLVAALLSTGCCPNATHPLTGKLLLELALEADTTAHAVVPQLIKAGANPRLANREGVTPYEIARKQRSRAFALIADAALEILLQR
eukprot:TRINITY_DN15127_c0_g1_i1.p1 TRINITY_DN15127_c0_g1~~TRINITY_DN15127_c0_g1_i1.p1  ORF type:complete len:180 (+),score=41.59 TRINITY_DN15127_c0_g1_i1:44-583(+)